MPDFVSALPFIGMVIILLLGSIAGGIACKFILVGIHQQREQQVRWYRQPRIVVGIALLVTCVAQVPNALVSVSTQRPGVSFSTVTLFNAMANASLLFLFAVALYAKILEVLSRRLPGGDD